MPSTSRALHRLGAPLLAFVLIAWSGAAAEAVTGEQPVQLSVTAVGQDGPYFDLTLGPGRSRLLQVELGNSGPVPIVARTYAADAATIVNGGFGAALHDAEQTGTTTWVDHPTRVITLAADRAVVQSFTVTVPPSTPPGEYLTSIVLENEDPVSASGPVAVEQVVRQVVAVAVRVPGPLTPRLAVASAGHTVAGTHSMVAVEVSNPGNRRLTPTAELAVHDATGRLVTKRDVTMDSFYAGTTTAVEIGLARLLEPGNYTVDLVLTDVDRGARAAASGLPFTVGERVRPAGAPAGLLPDRVADVLQGAPSGLPVLAFLSGLAVAAALLVAGSWWLRRRGHGRSVPGPVGRESRSGSPVVTSPLAAASSRCAPSDDRGGP